MDDRCIVYRIDKNKTIVYVSDNWDLFAMANKGDHLAQGAVLNKPLFGFINEWQCRHLYELLLDWVARTGERVSFSYRCDSPDIRRHMHMDIVPVDNELTEFQSCIVNEQRRQYQPLLDAERDRGRDFVVICSWCKKIKTASDQWLEVEDAVTTMSLFMSPLLPDITHGICPTCYQELREKYT